MEGAWEACSTMFGIVQSVPLPAPARRTWTPSWPPPRNYLGDELPTAARTFKVETKRADKTLPHDLHPAVSQDDGRRAGTRPIPTWRWTSTIPDYTVYVEVRDYAAYVHGPAEPGAGGLPIGMGGRAVVPALRRHRQPRWPAI